MRLNSLAVFCGSSLGSRDEYGESARQVGETLANRGIRLIYGGGDTGLMGVMANAALSSGGRVTGIVPRAPRPYIPDHMAASTIVVETIHARKAMMSDLADGFLALPGGSGTLEELAEQWTWAQIGLHKKPCGLINVLGFYDPFISQVRNMLDAGFTRGKFADSLITGTDVIDVLDRFSAYQPPKREA